MPKPFTSGSSYTPMMSPAEARKRVAWQEKVYRYHLKQAETITMDFLGRQLTVSPHVMAPVPYDLNLLSQAVLKEVKASDSVLDLGTGSGVQAIVAASKAKRVLAVDVNPEAVRCARTNVARNGLMSRIRVLRSDLFQRAKGRYSLILFDPPFRWTTPRDAWELSSADPGYRTLQAFFRESRAHLTPGGRILLHFGTSADLAYLKHLIRAHGFRRQQVRKFQQENGWSYFVFRLYFLSPKA
jgi:release factor glutamine methyltransferase